MPELTEDLPIAAITVNFQIQMRADGIDTDTRAEYAEILQNKGWVFPPVVVFRDGADLHLADGFHRYAAALDSRFTEIPADVRNGGARDALLFSCGANAGHGRRRSNADKRRAISVMLDDSEWGQASSRWIAAQVGCDDHTVARVRLERDSAARRGEDPSTAEFRSWDFPSDDIQNTTNLNGDDAPTDQQSPQVRKCKDGRTMDTTCIGRTLENDYHQPDNLTPKNRDRTNPAVVCERQKMIIAAALARIREHQAAMHHSDILPLCTMLLDAARHHAGALPAAERARLAELASMEGDSDSSRAVKP